MTDHLFRGDGVEHGRSRRDDFDPISEGQRYGLAPEVSEQIWRHARRESTNNGLCDEDLARACFAQMAERVAACGRQLGPPPFKWTRMDAASGAVPVDNIVAAPVPGKTTQVLARASGRARAGLAGVPGRTTLVAGQADSDACSPDDSRGFFRRYVSGGHAALTRLALAIDARDGDAALVATQALQGDLRWARHHLANGLAHEGGLQQALAGLAGSAEPLVAKLPSMRAGNCAPELWAPASAEWRAVVGAPTARPEAASAGDLAVIAPSSAAPREVVPPGPRRPLASQAAASASWMPGPPVGPAWATDVAALIHVVQRQAAMIFRRALGEDDVDLDDPAISAARDRARAGEPLPDAIRRAMEARLGADFRHVCVHTDGVAARAAEALHARAFTLGEDIFFAAGAFAPSEDAGQRLLVHELTHVVQAQQGRVPAGHGHELSRPGDALEQEAAAAYDRTVVRHTEAADHAPAPTDRARHAPTPAESSPRAPGPSARTSDAPGPFKSGRMLRAPGDRPAQASAGNVTWLAWDAELMRGFVDGFAGAAGKGFTPEARDKILRDFKDPQSLLAIYQGVQQGIIEGAFDDLRDNVEGLIEAVGWLARNLPVMGGMSYEDFKDELEWLVDPAAKAAREAEKRERRWALLDGFSQFAAQVAKDPSIIASLGQEFGQAAGDRVAHLYTMFAEARPLDKGRMVGHGLGYVAMEIALLFVGPETLIAKAPAAVAKLVRGGGAAAQTILRLMEKIPSLRKLLVAAGRLGKVAKTVSPEAKLLAHLEQAIVDKVLRQGLRFEEIAQLAKLDKAAAEKLLRELPAKEVLELEKQLGKAKLEALSKDKTAKEIQEIADQLAAEKALADKAAADKAAADKAAADKVAADKAAAEQAAAKRATVKKVAADKAAANKASAKRAAAKKAAAEKAAIEKAAAKNVAGASFSSTEREIITEAEGVLKSPEFQELRAAHANSKSVTIHINGVMIQYEPGLPASGMTMFGEEGFLLGPDGFVSSSELTKTVLHELHRLRTSASAGGVSGELAASETQAAFDFAEKAAKEIQ